jgi:hypothetical protein
MADLGSGEYSSETRQLSRDEQRVAAGGGPPGLVVVALVVLILGIVAFMLLR